MNSVTKNKYVWLALALCVALLAGAVYLPVISTVLQVVPPTGTAWLVILSMSLVPMILGQLLIRLGFAPA